MQCVIYSTYNIYIEDKWLNTFVSHHQILPFPIYRECNSVIQSSMEKVKSVTNHQVGTEMYDAEGGLNFIRGKLHWICSFFSRSMSSLWQTEYEILKARWSLYEKFIRTEKIRACRTAYSRRHRLRSVKSPL